ncbi:MAG: hypothetical protein RSA01_05175 [Clostridium sp.]|uniref:hypothetical protein n=1 Tax=Clostridium sp. TaxID=1506 RepID=UPI002FC88DB1
MSYNTNTPPEGYSPIIPEYVTEPTLKLKSLPGPVIRVYENFIPWYGSNRNNATLLYLGAGLGVDYFIHPMSDLTGGIPSNTNVVLISSNSEGDLDTALQQNDSVAQANLKEFTQNGGVLIVDMGSNLVGGGFIAPGSTGTPDSEVRPDPVDKASLTAESLTHPFVNGPITLNNDNIDLSAGFWIAHGNLEEGITLPNNATILMTATFSGVEKPILAEYCYGSGKVILDTITKEFVGQQPLGVEQSNILTNLFAYALSPRATADCRMTRGIKLF